MTLNNDVNLGPSRPLAGPAKAPAGPAAEAPASMAKDAAQFSYTEANQPRGLEKPLRVAQEIVSNADDVLHTGVTEASRAGQWLQNSFFARLLQGLPEKASAFFQRVADGKTVGLLGRLTQTPFYGAFATTMAKVSPFVGLVMAPFDLKNCVNLWKDPEALLPHKILTTVRTGTGILMCLGGAAGLVVLPALGFPAAGAAVVGLALKIGLVNLAASVPYWAKGIGSAVGWVGSKVGGLFKKAFSAL